MSSSTRKLEFPSCDPQVLSCSCPLPFSAAAPSRAETPLLYLPFDGNLQAAVSGGAGVPKAADERMQFRPGLRGRRCAQRRSPLEHGRLFQRGAGTIAFWLRPTWPGGDKLTRTLFSLYGSREWIHRHDARFHNLRRKCFFFAS